MEIYDVSEILPKFIFQSDITGNDNKRLFLLGNENPNHKIEIYNTLPEIANTLRRTLMNMDSCAFPDITIKEICKTREIDYFADTFVTPYVEYILKTNKKMLEIYEQTLDKPHITIIKNTSKIKKETIIRHIAMIPINLDPHTYLKCPEAFTFTINVKNDYKNNQRISVTSKDIKYKNIDKFKDFRPNIRELFSSSKILENNSDLKNDLEDICVSLINTRNDIDDKNQSQNYLLNILSEQFVHIMYLDPSQELYVEMMPLISTGNHHASFDQFNKIVMYQVEDKNKIEIQRKKILEYMKNPNSVNPIVENELIQNTSDSFLSVEPKDLLKNFELHDRQRFVKTRDSDNQPNHFNIIICRNIQNQFNNSGKKNIHISLKTIEYSIMSIIENLTIFKDCDEDHPLKSKKTPEENIKIQTTLVKDIDDNIEKNNIYLYIILKFPEILQSITKKRKLYVNLKTTIEYFCQLILCELLIKKKTHNLKTDNILHANKTAPLKYYGIKQPHPLCKYIESHILLPYNNNNSIGNYDRLKINEKNKINNYAIEVCIDYYNLCLAFVRKILNDINL